MKKAVLLIAVIVGLLAPGCSRYDTERLNLKDSLEKSVADINRAVKTISSTRGFEVLSADAVSLKSEVDFRDSISLELIAGIYDFKPDLGHHRDFFIPYRLFEKTGDSDQMIVNMPEKFAFRPLYLHNCNANDTNLVNNFTITASDYHYYFTWFNSFDYKLSAGFTLDAEDIGSLDVESKGGGESGRSYTSTYNFEDGYNINVSFQAGDSSVSSFALSQDDEVLLKETTIRVREDYHHREKTYILTIGNIEIVRGTSIDSIQVYLDGVLQKEAGAIIIDETNTEEGSICRKRDILLTFDDGTTAKLSELIGPAREVLATLVDSLRSMNFATRVVDYIAISIYYHSYCMEH